MVPLGILNRSSYHPPSLGFKQSSMDRNDTYILSDLSCQGTHTSGTIRCKYKIKGLLGKLTSREAAEWMSPPPLGTEKRGMLG